MVIAVLYILYVNHEIGNRRINPIVTVVKWVIYDYQAIRLPPMKPSISTKKTISISFYI